MYEVVGIGSNGLRMFDLPTPHVIDIKTRLRVTLEGILKC